MMIMGLSICSSPYTSRCNLLACLRQTLMVILINIPTVSFGLAMGWVSLATGKSVQVALAGETNGDVETNGGSDVGAPGWQMITAATITFCASLAGMPLCARVLATGRKPAIIATSVLFMLCWALKLYGDGWWVVAARACAGVGGAGAWILAPLVAREMCSGSVRGAAVSALVLANNLGMLLMYLAALLQISHTTVLWSCFSLSLAHCAVFMFVPESPQYLAAHGHMDRARDSLAWLRGVRRDDPSLSIELAEFITNQNETDVPALNLIKDMLSDRGRRSAFLLSCVMVLGQEVSGVLALLQYAERVFLVAASTGASNGTDYPPSHFNQSEHVSQFTELEKPATHAVLLGTAQLIASACALYLIEKVGRKRLMVCCGAVTGSSLAGCALAVWCGVGSKGGAGLWAPILLATAVFADSAGLEPAPYAMVADMFDYQYRSCALMLLDGLTWLGNAVETLLFPVLVTHAGLSVTLAMCAVLTLSVTVYVLWCAPETKGRTTQQIYDEILKRTDHTTNDDVTTKL